MQGGTTEAGTVAFTDATGTTTDVTTTFSGDVAITADGTYTVCDGTYAVNLDIDADVELVSANGAASTTLDGTSSGTVVAVGDGYNVTITDLTITGGYADEGAYLTGMGGGVYVGASSTATITGSTISSNYGFAGGGICVEDGVATVSTTDFDTNDGDYGGDVMLWDGSADLSDIASTDAYSTASGAFLYLGSYSATASLDLDSSTIDGADSTYGTIYVDDSSGSGADFTCETSSVTNSTTSSLYGAIFLGESGATATSFGCDWGTSAGGDDNDPADVYTELSDEQHTYEDGAFFTCTGDGCDDHVVYTGATGSILLADSDGWTTTPNSYACYLEWDFVGTGSEDVCDACDFAFDGTWTLDTTTSVTTDCGWPTTDLSFGFAFASEPAYYTDPVLYYSYYGSFYPWMYAERDGNTVTATFGVLDYSYTYYTYTYYYTYYGKVELNAY